MFRVGLIFLQVIDGRIYVVLSSFYDSTNELNEEFSSILRLTVIPGLVRVDLKASQSMPARL